MYPSIDDLKCHYWEEEEEKKEQLYDYSKTLTPEEKKEVIKKYNEKLYQFWLENMSNIGLPAKVKLDYLLGR